MHESFGHMGGGWIIWLLLFLFVVWLVAGRFLRFSGRKPGKQNPVDMLNRRFAAGEISTEEYRHMKKELTSFKRGDDA